MARIINQIPNETIDYGVKMLNAMSQWGSTKGENINIAVLDTGIDYNHYELVHCIKGGINFTTDDRNDYMDRNGHGTFCAGVIAGADNSGGIIGVAPEANIYAVKVLADDSRGSLYWLAQGLDWCIQNDIHIISMSLGYDKDVKEIHNLLKEAHDKGIIIVAAAGNNPKMKQVDFPARYDEVIGVTAIDNRQKLGSFCNTGVNVEIAAPGVNITSTYLNNSFATMSGTSMATPHIVGAIALIQARSLKEDGRFKSLAEIKQILKNNVKDLGAAGKDTKYGNGMFHF